MEYKSVLRPTSTGSIRASLLLRSHFHLSDWLIVRLQVLSGLVSPPPQSHSSSLGYVTHLSIRVKFLGLFPLLMDQLGRKSNALAPSNTVSLSAVTGGGVFPGSTNSHTTPMLTSFVRRCLCILLKEAGRLPRNTLLRNYFMSALAQLMKMLSVLRSCSLLYSWPHCRVSGSPLRCAHSWQPDLLCSISYRQRLIQQQA